MSLPPSPARPTPDIRLSGLLGAERTMLRNHASGITGFAVSPPWMSSLTTIPGALLAYWAGQRMSGLAPYALSISAASFIYIALADLVPHHREQTRLRMTLLQCGGIAAGIGTILLVHGTGHAGH